MKDANVKRSSSRGKKSGAGVKWTLVHEAAEDESKNNLLGLYIE